MSQIFTPRPYQTDIRDYILDNPRCAIWAGMGLGKSAATLSAIDALQFVDGAPTLVLAPLRVARSTWPDETSKWTEFRSLSVIPVTGSEAERRMAVRMDAPIHACNYENIPWLVEYWGPRWPYRTVVSDESSRLKSFRLRQGGVRTQALAKMAHTKVKRFVELTGTPAGNGLQDLWAPLWFLDKGARLGLTYEAFKQRWFQRNHNGFGISPLPHAQAEIQNILRDICLTVDAKDYFDLKEPIITDVFVDLPMKARKLYRDMERDMFMQLDVHGVEAFGAAARTIKCLQLCLAAGTEVLTKRGWANIETVTPNDSIWDGTAWVNTSGVARQGMQEVIDCWGVRMTSEHKVLTNRGWFTAKEIEDGAKSSGFDRSSFWLPDGSWSSGVERSSASNVVGEMCLRGNSGTGWPKPAKQESRPSEILRMQARRNAAGCVGQPRYDLAPGLSLVAGVKAAVQQRYIKGLPELWRAWHNSMRKVGGVLREFLGRHGACLGSRVEYRKNEQQQGLRARELPVGYSQGPGQQHPDERGSSHSDGSYDVGASSRTVRNQLDNAECSAREIRMAAGEGANNPSTKVETFDLLNVGPLNQFVVRGRGGPFIVHNCNGAAYVGEGNTEWQEIHDEKLQALDSILEEAAGMPVLVAYQFKSDLARLQRAFPKGKTLDQNPQTLKDWNAGKIPVMFAHPASAGHGLNLQDGGNILVFFSVDWNLENHMQIIERIGPTRQMQAGHDRNVFIYRILARDTVDEMVLERLTTKREVQDILLSAMKQRRNAK